MIQANLTQRMLFVRTKMILTLRIRDFQKPDSDPTDTLIRIRWKESDQCPQYRNDFP